MTIREAFAKAGHPVPAGAKIYANAVVNEEWNWWYDFDNKARACFVWDDGDWSQENGIDDVYMIFVPLDNLPAIDAFDALPECVRKEVKGK